MKFILHKSNNSNNAASVNTDGSNASHRRWVGLPSFGPRKKKPTKNKSPYLIIDESDRTEDTELTVQLRSAAPCKAIALSRKASCESYGSSSGGTGSLSRHSSCGSGGSGSRQGSLSATTSGSSHRSQSQQQQQPVQRRSRSHSRTRLQSRSKSESKKPSQRTASASRERTPAAVQPRPRQRSLSQSRRSPSQEVSSPRALIHTMLVGSSTNQVSRQGGGGSNQGVISRLDSQGSHHTQVCHEGNCPHHPYVQLRRFSTKTNSWKTLLDSCPVCGAMDGESLASCSLVAAHHSQARHGVSRHHDPPSESHSRQTRSSRSTSQSRTRSKSRSVSKESSRRSSLLYLPSSNAATTKSVRFA